MQHTLLLQLGEMQLHRGYVGATHHPVHISELAPSHPFPSETWEYWRFSPSSCKWWHKKRQLCGLCWQMVSGHFQKEKKTHTLWAPSEGTNTHTGGSFSTCRGEAAARVHCLSSCGTSVGVLCLHCVRRCWESNRIEEENATAPPTPSNSASACLWFSVSKSSKGVPLWPRTNHRNLWRAFFLQGGNLETGCKHKCGTTSAKWLFLAAAWHRYQLLSAEFDF